VSGWIVPLFRVRREFEESKGRLRCSMTIDKRSCLSDSGVPHVGSISDDDVDAENCLRSGDDPLGDGHDKEEEETEGSKGDLEGARSGSTVLYISDGDEGDREGEQRSEGHVDNTANGL